MKHILKRYRFERHITEEEKKHYNEIFDRVPIDNPRKPDKHTKIYMVSQSENGDKIIEGFFFQEAGRNYCAPEPDPILIYFHLAYMNNREIIKHKQILLSKLRGNVINESVSNDFYIYFGLCVNFATSLVTCLEAFINSNIPYDFEYRKRMSGHTAIFNKDDIEMENFDFKLNVLMKEITGKLLDNDDPVRQAVIELIRFRNMIVHTKKVSEGMTPYDGLFKKTFSFNYERALCAVRDYINFYKPDYIVECGCGADF